MEGKEKKVEEVYDETQYTEVNPIDVFLDYEIVKETAKNLARGIVRAKRLSDIKKERKPKINKKTKKLKKPK